MLKLAKVLKIESQNKNCYDLTIANNHNFFCNNVLIHNCDYRGEIKVVLCNQGNTNFDIKVGDRIAQLVFSKVSQATFCVTEDLKVTDRGQGGFGSTGV